jgi:probable HAF family extracellular repeat protein
MRAKPLPFHTRLLYLEKLEERCLLSYAITDLGTLGGASSLARGLNTAGEVVGQAQTLSGAAHGFLYNDGALTDLGTLGGTNSDARAINELGQVVGAADLADGTSHAFLYNDTMMSDLGTLPGNSSSSANAVNDAGQAAGVSYGSNMDQRAFLYSDGAMADIGGLPGADFSGARGINAGGQVIGNSHFRDSTGGYVRAFLDTDGVLTDLGTLGGMNTEIQGVNAGGQVVGFSDTLDATHAFLYGDGELADLGTLPGYTSSEAMGVNSCGQVVGEADAGSVAHAFLYRDGAMVDLNDLIPEGSGWVLTHATGINDAEQIVGQGTNPDGEAHAYLLTPGESPAASRRLHLEPRVAQGLGALSPVRSAVLKIIIPDSSQCANPAQLAGAETRATPMAPGDPSTARLTASLGHQATDGAFPGLGDLLASPLD